MELAAQAFALGVSDGLSAITSDDPVRLILLTGVVQRALETRKILDDNLACHIAERVGQLFKSR